jgi:RNA polymerase sigma factor (sigma-70 family)
LTASSASAPAPAARPPLHQTLLSDERLARFVEDGCERAFAAIYERYHQRLYRYSHSILRDGDDAYDALQSTLANALAALQRGQRDAPLGPWLFRIAHNETISLIRRREPDQGSLGPIESCVPSAAARADERARLALLVSDLGELPERQRAVLLMRELSGLSHKEIAAALGISVRTVGHAILAARRSLGEFEEGRAMVCEPVQRSISRANGRLLPRARAHVRDCTACAAFAAAIRARRADLQALAPPLTPVAAAGLLAGLHAVAPTQGAGSGSVIAAGLSGKTAGAVLAAKALAGVAVMAVAGASVTGAVGHLTGAHPSLAGTARATGAFATSRRRRQPATANPTRAAREIALASATPGGAVGGPPVPSAGSASGIASPSGTGPSGRAGAAGRSTPEGVAASVHRHSNRSRSGAAGSGLARHAHGTGERGPGATPRAGASTGQWAEQRGNSSGNMHNDGDRARSGEPQGSNGARADSANATIAPSSGPEAPRPVGETPPPTATEGSGGHGQAGPHDPATPSSPI